MIENDLHPIRKVVLAGLDKQNAEFDYEMIELANLAEANYMEVVGTVTQKLERPNAATYFGKGKVEELKEAVEYYEADMVGIRYGCRHHGSYGADFGHFCLTC